MVYKNIIYSEYNSLIKSNQITYIYSKIIHVKMIIHNCITWLQFMARTELSFKQKIVLKSFTKLYWSSWQTKVKVPYRSIIKFSKCRLLLPHYVKKSHTYVTKYLSKFKNDKFKISKLWVGHVHTSSFKFRQIFCP